MLHGKTLLIAEADRAFAFELETRCEQLGFDAVSVSNLADFVPRYDKLQPSILFFDYRLTNAGGLSICDMMTADRGGSASMLLGRPVYAIALAERIDYEMMTRCMQRRIRVRARNSAFWDRLPCLLRNLSPVNTRQQSAPPARYVPDDRAAPSAAYDQSRILVIEDDPGIVRIFSRYLNPTDFEIEHCDNIEEAMRLAWNAVAVFCDVHLPDGLGTAVIRDLRDAGFDRPIIVMTGDSSQSTMLDCARSRIDGILLKPFDKASLLRRMADALRIAIEEQPPESVPVAVHGAH